MTTNIADVFTQVAGDRGNAPAIIEAKTGKIVSFEELNETADGYAHYLSKNTVRAGDRVILMVTPSSDFISITFALFKIGATVILIDPGMGYRNLLRCIENVRPDIFIGVPKAYLFTTLCRGTFGRIKKKFCCGNSFGVFGTDIRKRAVGSHKRYKTHRPGDNDLAAIIFTTGSTGPPKGVRYEHSIFMAQLNRIRDYYGITSQDVDQPAFPLFALFSTALGACAVIPDMDPTRPAQVDPQKFIESIEKYKVTYSFGSPAIWNVVSSYCLDNNLKLAGVKKVLMAGAPVPGKLLKGTQAILDDDAQIYTPYGATESLPIVSIEGREIIDETLELSRRGMGVCVGRPLPGIQLKIIAIDEEVIAELDGAVELDKGEIGEIIVQGDVVTRGYENNPAETSMAKIFDNDSFWHRMGDTGYLDKQGRLWFCGRKAHRVIVGEKTMFTIRCEAIVNEHPEVYRSALVGVSNNKADGGTEPVIIVQPEEGCTLAPAVLIEEVKSIAAANELTRNVHTILIHNNFPVDIRHNAKIFREKLADWAYQQLKREK